MKKPSPTGRARIEAKTRNHCAYCGVDLTNDRSLATLDHIIPAAHGGTDSLTNLVLACRICNQQKGGKDLEEFRAYMGEDVGGIPHFTLGQRRWLKMRLNVDIAALTPFVPFWFEAENIDISEVPGSVITVDDVH